jgi:hypothetical protein
MIPKLHRRGVALHWLLRYLFSTRENEQHHDPRVIAAWAYATTGDITELQPPLTPDGRYCLRRLTSLLHQPVAAGINPPDHPVWHCSIHNDADDPVLTDLDWANAATMIMDAVGLSPHGDLHAVRWIAVRHADNHIHIVATLVRQDGRTTWAWHDARNVQAACRQLEQQHGLRRLDIDHARQRYPTHAETNKATRQHLSEIPRQRLRSEVRAAAAAASTEQDFYTRIADAGLLLRLHTDHNDHITGYSVALTSHHTAAASAIWYSGHALGRELSLTKLRGTWQLGTQVAN